MAFADKHGNFSPLLPQNVMGIITVKMMILFCLFFLNGLEIDVSGIVSWECIDFNRHEIKVSLDAELMKNELLSLYGCVCLCVKGLTSILHRLVIGYSISSALCPYNHRDLSHDIYHYSY